MIGRAYKHSLFPNDLRLSNLTHLKETLANLDFVIRSDEPDSYWEGVHAASLVTDLPRCIHLNAQSVAEEDLYPSSELKNWLTQHANTQYTKRITLHLLAQQLKSDEMALSIYKHYCQSLISLLVITLNSSVSESGIAITSITRGLEADLSYTANLFYSPKWNKVFLRVKDFGCKVLDTKAHEESFLLARSTFLYEVKADGFHLVNISTDSTLIRDMLMGNLPATPLNQHVQVIPIAQKERLNALAKALKEEDDKDASLAYEASIDAQYGYSKQVPSASWAQTAGSCLQGVYQSVSGFFAPKAKLNISVHPFIESSYKETVLDKNLKNAEIQDKTNALVKKQSEALLVYLGKRAQSYRIKDFFSSADRDKRIQFTHDLNKKFECYMTSTNCTQREANYLQLIYLIEKGMYRYKPRASLFGFFCPVESADSLRYLLRNMKKDLQQVHEEVKKLATDASMLTERLHHLKSYA